MICYTDRIILVCSGTALCYNVNKSSWRKNKMINTVSISFMFITLLICFVLPMILILKFNLIYKPKTIFFAVGFILFLFFERVLRMPFLKVLEDYTWYTEMTLSPWKFALFVAFTAAFFGETGKFLIYRVYARDHMLWANGVALGIGFGSMEAMIVTGSVYARQFMFSLMLNSGRFGAKDEIFNNYELSNLVSEMQNTASWVYLIAGAERLFMLFIHMALSLLTMYGAKSGKLRYLAFVIGIHTVIVSSAILLTGFNYWPAQIFLCLIAVISVLFVFNMSKKDHLFKVK